MLWAYANGFIPSYPGIPGGKSTWARPTHRGVQMLDQIRIRKKHRQYVFCKRFEIRYNTAFAQVIRYCSNPERDPERQTWMTTGLIESFEELHRLGFAYSFEAWENQRLVGGGFGVLLGGHISVDSMFHLEDNASKAAYVQMLLGLRERGFTFVDINEPSPFMARWGAVWVPYWKFEQLLQRSLWQPRPFLDGRAPTPFPLAARLGLPMRFIAAKIARRIRGRLKNQDAAAAAMPSALIEEDEQIGELPVT